MHICACMSKYIYDYENSLIILLTEKCAKEICVNRYVPIGMYIYGIQKTKKQKRRLAIIARNS